MKVQLIKTREKGKDVPRNEFSRQVKYTGDLEIVESQDLRTRRAVRIARLVQNMAQFSSLQLYDPVLLWMNERRFVLTGFERVGPDDHPTQFAQSWLIGVDEGEPAEDLTVSLREAKRLSRERRG